MTLATASFPQRPKMPLRNSRVSRRRRHQVGDRLQELHEGGGGGPLEGHDCRGKHAHLGYTKGHTTNTKEQDEGRRGSLEGY